jgi:hypothetical protein
LKEKINSYGIVNVSGTDLTGRPIIIFAASRLPEADVILKEKNFFKSHQHFFDLLFEFLQNILEGYVSSGNSFNNKNLLKSFLIIEI